jgi:hypothetical protein
MAQGTISVSACVDVEALSVGAELHATPDVAALPMAISRIVADLILFTLLASASGGYRNRRARKAARESIAARLEKTSAPGDPR